MFSDCISLTSIDFSSFKSEKLTYIEYMFEGCSQIKEIEIPNLKITNIKSMTGMFFGCINLYFLDISSFEIYKSDIDITIFNNLIRSTGLIIVNANFINKIRSQIPDGWHIEYS